MTSSALDDEHPERWVEVDGRRWRASDPAIPGRLRAELVHELMDARRAVGAAKHSGDQAAERAARARVQDAKVALGERGRAWWEESAAEERDERLGAAVRTLLRHRAPESTICPSDAARVACGAGWRHHLDDARRVAFDLQAAGAVEVRSGGERVAAPADARGPLRIARGEAWLG